VGDSAADRVVDLLQRAMRAAELEPRRTAALVTASASPDPAVRDHQIELMATMDGVLANAMGDLGPELEARLVRTLRMVWFGWLVGWVNGWHDTTTVNAELESAVRLLLGDR
jgi:hypothetical protein